jgi:hypothetical protein
MDATYSGAKALIDYLGQGVASFVVDVSLEPNPPFI